MRHPNRYPRPMPKGDPLPRRLQLDVEIEALKKELAQKDETIRAFVATLRLTGKGRDPMATRAVIADELENGYFRDGTP